MTFGMTLVQATTFYYSHLHKLLCVSLCDCSSKLNKLYNVIKSVGGITSLNILCSTNLPNLYLHLGYSIVLGDGGKEKGEWDADTKNLQNRVIRLISKAGKVAFCWELFQTLHF